MPDFFNLFAMRTILLLAAVCLSFTVPAQNVVDWDGRYQLQLSDFQSPATQIGGTTIMALNTGSTLNFAFQMTNAEFLFTKNFNSKVSCSFPRAMASLVAPDSVMAMDLVRFARYQFDLSELYARKLRKQLYEQKGAFSDASFYRPIFDSVQNAFINRYTMAEKKTRMGLDTAKVAALHAEVLQEINTMPDYCKTCKVSKKKKHKR